MTEHAMTAEQQAFFYRHGYLVLPGIVPAALVRAARRLIYQNLGRVATHAGNVARIVEDPPRAGQLDKLKRAVQKIVDAERDPAILALFNDTPIKPLLETAMGAPLRPARGAQLARRSHHLQPTSKRSMFDSRRNPAS